jgi:predicted enzyme related to lactoylglutathione lyase
MDDSHGRRQQASRFVWYELHTANAQSASDFYSKVLPWKILAEPGQSGYSLIDIGPTHIGGVLEKPADPRFNNGKDGWLAYIAVASLKASVKKLGSLGGKLLRPADEIAQVGQFAVVADPQGAIFVLFEPAPGSKEMPLVDGTEGDIGWHELTAADYAAAYAFYAELFGWEKGTSVPMDGGAIYQIFTANGVDTGAMMTRFDASEAPYWRYYFNVADAGVTSAKVTEHGGTVTWGPMAVATGQIVACCTDPHGALFGLVAPAPK